VSDDFDFEPIPDWRALAVRAFHIRKVAVYFAILVAWRGLTAHADGLAMAAASRQMLWIALLGATCMAVLTLLAWAYARSTVYTITSRRIVIRSGVALPLTINIPFAQIESAAVKVRADGSGDIPVRIRPGNRIAALALWPNWRPWHFTRPEPMLRCISEAGAVASLLAGALTGAPVQPQAQTPQMAPQSDPPALPTPATS